MCSEEEYGVESNIESKEERYLTIESHAFQPLLVDKNEIPTNLFSSVCTDGPSMYIKFHDYLFWKGANLGIFQFFRDLNGISLVLSVSFFLLLILYFKYRREYHSHTGNTSRPIGISRIPEILLNSLYPFLIFFVSIFLYSLLTVYVLVFFPLGSIEQMQYAAAVIYSKVALFYKLVVRILVDSVLDLYMHMLWAKLEDVPGKERGKGYPFQLYFYSMTWCFGWYVLKSLLVALLASAIIQYRYYHIVYMVSPLISVLISLAKARGTYPRISPLVFFTCIGVLIIYILYYKDKIMCENIFTHNHLRKFLVMVYIFISKEVKLSTFKFVAFQFTFLVKKDSVSRSLQPLLAIDSMFSGARGLLLLLDFCPLFLSPSLENDGYHPNADYDGYGKKDKKSMH